LNAGDGAEREVFYIIQVKDERSSTKPLGATAPAAAASPQNEVDMAVARRREMKLAEKEFQSFLLASLNEHYKAVNSKVQDIVEKEVVARLEAAHALKDGTT